MNLNICPCCDKVCQLERPRCKYGVQYRHSGIIPENMNIVWL